MKNQAHDVSENDWFHTNDLQWVNYVSKFQMNDYRISQWNKRAQMNPSMNSKKIKSNSRIK